MGVENMSSRNNLSRILSEKGLTLDQLINDLDVPVSYIEEITEIYLGRKEFSPDILRIVAKHLDVKEEDLLSYKRRNLYHNIGAQLRQAREKKGLTLVELGKISGVSYTHISEIERGKTSPSLKTLDKLADALEISTSYFLQMETAFSLGEKIRRLREKQNLTQQQLADKVGVSLSLIGQIETDRAKPALDTLEKIAIVFGVSIVYFLLSDSEDQHIRDGIERTGVTSTDKLNEEIQDLNNSDINFLIEMVKLFREHYKIGEISSDPYLDETVEILHLLTNQEDKRFVLDNARYVLNKTRAKAKENKDNPPRY